MNLSEKKQSIEKVRNHIKSMYIEDTCIEEAQDSLVEAGSECLELASALGHIRGAHRSTAARILHRIAKRVGVQISSALPTRRRRMEDIFCEVDGCDIILPYNLMLQNHYGSGPSFCCASCAYTSAYSADWGDRSFQWREPEPEYEDEDEDYHTVGCLRPAFTNPIEALGQKWVCEPNEKVHVNRKIQGPKTNTRLFGFEIECIIPDRRNAVRDLEGSELGSYAIMKEDGSLGTDGVEVCTLPITRRAAPRVLKEISEDLLRKNARAWNRSQCGLHIHVTAASATWATWGKVDRFIHHEANQQFINMIAGREPNGFCNRNTFFAPEYHKIQGAKKKANGGDRYQAINFATGKSTVEFRLFRGNVSYAGLMRSMEFCDSLLEWAMTQSIGSPMHSFIYVQWLNSRRKQYPHLTKYIFGNVDERNLDLKAA